jgi:hypothetical protein
MITTSNSEVATLPVSSAAIATKPKSKPAKTTEPLNSGAVVPWDALPKGVVAYRAGDSYTVLKGKFAGDTRKRTQDAISLPSVSKLMEMNEGLTQQQAETMIREAGTRIKPGVMAEINRAGSNAAFIVRSYVNKVRDNGKGEKTQDIAVKLHSVNVESTIAKLAREYGLSEEEVSKRLNIQPAKGENEGYDIHMAKIAAKA